jgi:two-component system KDP operon response regulator KdpE
MAGSKPRNVAQAGRLTALLINSSEQRHFVEQVLRTAGFRMIKALGISDALRYLKTFAPGLVIVGEDLPSVDGVDPLAALRGLTSAPIVVIGSGGQYGLVRAFDRGADAYVDQTITPVVFFARIRAMLRRYGYLKISKEGIP